MRIFFKILNGTKFKLDINKNETIRNVKLKVQEKLKWHPDDQRFLFRGIPLEDERIVEQCGMDNKSVIYVGITPK